MIISPHSAGASPDYIFNISCISSLQIMHSQCFFQTLSVIVSIGTFFVSGPNRHVKIVITKTQQEKNKNIKYLKAQSMDKEDCAMINVKSVTVKLYLYFMYNIWSI